MGCQSWASNSLIDAMVTLGFLATEELDKPYKIKDNTKLSVKVDGNFTWEIVLSTTGKSKFAAPGSGKGGAAAQGEIEFVKYWVHIKFVASYSWRAQEKGKGQERE